MYLAFSLLSEIFPQSSGIKDPDLFFHTVADIGEAAQPKGLFIPLWDNPNELKTAINNGAVAAIWDLNTPIPGFTPNHFPLFYTSNLWKDVSEMLRRYIKILEQEDESIDMSKFVFLDKKLLNEKLQTYDKAVKYEEILPLVETLIGLRRG